MILEEVYTPEHATAIIFLLLFVIAAVFITFFALFPHIAKGDFKSKDELKKYLIIGYVLMASCIISAMFLYNLDNSFSILNDTFSFLGAWKLHENPNGWWFFTINMIVFGFWTVPLNLYMGKRLAPLDKTVAIITTILLLLGSIGMVLTGCFPDVHGTEDFMGGVSSNQVHNKVALIAFGGIGIGVIVNGLLLRKDYSPKFFSFDFTPKPGRRILNHKKVSKPFIMITVVLACVAFFLIAWEIVWPIWFQPNGVGHWPGWGPFSFPLWEWTAIIGTYVWYGWFPYALPQEIPRVAPEANVKAAEVEAAEESKPEA